MEADPSGPYHKSKPKSVRTYRKTPVKETKPTSITVIQLSVSWLTLL